MSQAVVEKIGLVSELRIGRVISLVLIVVGEARRLVREE